jgi:hypothetical protein
METVPRRPLWLEIETGGVLVPVRHNPLVRRALGISRPRLASLRSMNSRIRSVQVAHNWGRTAVVPKCLFVRLETSVRETFERKAAMRSGRNQLITVAILASIVLVTSARPVECRADAPEATLPALVFVRPGTCLGATPPSGWSDLVVKALPRVASGDVETLPSFGVETATLLRTFILADVRPAPGSSPRFVLKRIGLGLCAPIKGEDTVVSGGDPESPPESFGFVEKQVLTRAEAELKKARLIARSQTFAVLASPAELKVGDGHEKVFLIYAILVDPATGRVDTWLWAVAARAERRTVPGSLNHLPPGLIYPCGLDVAADRLLGAIPVSWSFAMQALPPGRPLTTPGRLGPWLIDPGKIASNSEEFERLLRAEVSPGSKAQLPTAGKP